MSKRIGVSIPDELEIELADHPGLNRSEIAAKALKAIISDRLLCPCWKCEFERKKLAQKIT